MKWKLMDRKKELFKKKKKRKERKEEKGSWLSMI
jgi:hypothetical protein